MYGHSPPQHHQFTDKRSIRQRRRCRFCVCGTNNHHLGRRGAATGVVPYPLVALVRPFRALSFAAGTYQSVIMTIKRWIWPRKQRLARQRPPTTSPEKDTVEGERRCQLVTSASESLVRDNVKTNHTHIHLSFLLISCFLIIIPCLLWMIPPQQHSTLA